METTELLIPEEARQITNEVEKGLNFYRSSAYSIVTAEQYTSAAEDLKKVHSQEKKIGELRLSMTRPLDATKKAILEFFKIPEQYCADIKSAIGIKRLDYQREQDRIRREEEERIRKLQEAEAKKLEARAAKLKSEGRAEELRQEAQQIRETAPVTTIAPLEKSEGIRTVTNYKFEIIDPSKIPAEYLMPDEQKIGRVVRATRGEIVIPGVSTYIETKESSTGR